MSDPVHRVSYPNFRYLIFGITAKALATGGSPFYIRSQAAAVTTTPDHRKALLVDRTVLPSDEEPGPELGVLLSDMVGGEILIYVVAAARRGPGNQPRAMMRARHIKVDDTDYLPLQNLDMSGEGSLWETIAFKYSNTTEVETFFEEAPFLANMAKHRVQLPEQVVYMIVDSFKASRNHEMFSPQPKTLTSPIHVAPAPPPANVVGIKKKKPYESN